MMGFPRGVEVTHLTGPDTGWPIAAHCCHCHKTVITWSPYACKPADGDFYLLNGTCLDEELNVQHNLYPQFDYPWPSRLGPRPEEWTHEAYLAYWKPQGVK